MKRAYFLFTLAFLLNASYTQAQLDTLGVSQTALNFLQHDTFALNSTGLGNSSISSIIIYNLSDSVFNGKINIYYRVNNEPDSLANDSNTTVSFIPNFFDTINIHPHDTVNLGYLVFHLVQPTFSVGPTAVVIWPIATLGNTFVPAGDSASATFYVNDLSGINQPGAPNLKVYMQNQQLLVQSDNENPAIGVRIYDAIGSEILDREIPQNAVIAMDRFAAGIYFAEILFRDNKREVVKVFNMPNH